jgi:sigma-B regulation protein RsbU (phosphoserine phosphatase)
MELSLRYLRIQLARLGVWPGSRLARMFWYVAVLDLFLAGLRGALGSHGLGLGWWVKFLAWVAAFLFLVLAYRWLKAKLLWRLRNRLIVTYVFIGVIPAFLLVTMAFISLYLFASLFADFAVTSELDARRRSLEASNTAVANELASRLQKGEPLVLGQSAAADTAFGVTRVCAWKDSLPLPLCGSSLPFTLPGSLPAALNATVLDGGKLYLRSALSLVVKEQRLVVISSEVLDRPAMEKVAKGVGEIIVLAPLLSAPGNRDARDNFSVHAGPDGIVMKQGEAQLVPVLTAGTLPAGVGRLDKELDFLTSLTLLDWKSGNTTTALISGQTRPSILYARLSAFSDLASQLQGVLEIIAIIFGIIVLLALVVGTRLTRTVTGAIAQLYVATHHINRGDFSHRIPVKSKDQLAALSNSFNSMAESLEKLIVEQKEKQKLENELMIAQEVQAQLFPRKISQLPSLEVHGFCRPARTVSGDYYDFLTVDPHRMMVAVGDVSGKGISAALLMATIHSAVRAYSLEGIPILREPVAAGRGGDGLLGLRGVEVSTAALLSLLNHQLYSSTPAEKYATMFLGYYDGRERRLTYSNAGHLPPLVLGDGGSLYRLDRGGTVVGLFDDVSYEEASVQLQDGEIFLAYSDGVTEPENDFGEFGEERLVELVWENRQLPLAKISELVTSAVDDWIGAREQPDDVTLVLARAR